ncbi:hypothetical protein HK101_004779 [Irineochytrium annulatum]|nr:hypothetical protein HK101_004779 [Irineochytrium annulatum]
MDVGIIPSELDIPLLYLSLSPQLNHLDPNASSPLTVHQGSVKAERLSPASLSHRLTLPIPDYTSHIRLNRVSPLVTPLDIVVGVTTFFARAQQSIDVADHAVARFGVDVHFFMDEKDEKDVMYARYLRRPSYIRLHHAGTGDGASRWFHMVAELYRKRPDARFYLIADDDTQFFLGPLLRLLSTFDSNEPWYLGQFSELQFPNERHGGAVDIAFGGGGVVLSQAAIRRVVPILKKCEVTYKSIFGGDERLALCLAEKDVKLTRLPEFHQFDARGDLVGLFEKMHGMAAIHRPHKVQLWPFETGELQYLRLAKLERAADKLYLKRIAWNLTINGFTNPLVLTNAYTITMYMPNVLHPDEPVDLEKVEETFGYHILSDSGKAYAMDTQIPPPSFRMYWDAVIYARGPKPADVHVLANVYRSDRFRGVAVVYCKGNVFKPGLGVKVTVSKKVDEYVADGVMSLCA